MVLQHRRRGLLDLQEQRVLLVAALQQHDERPGADAADAHDLAGHVDDLEPLEQVAAIVLAASRGTARNCSWISVLQLVDGMPMLAARSRSGITIGGWLTIRYWPSTSSASFDSACRLSRVRAFSCAASRRSSPRFSPSFLLPRPSWTAPRLDAAHESCFRQARVPDVHRAHLGELGHRLPIGASPTRASRSRASASVKPLLRAAIVKLAAMRFTSYSNGPGSVSSKSLRSNNKRPLRRREHTEVRQVRVAAELHVQSGRRRVLQVGRHDLRRAPVERERRDHHPAVTNRHEVGLPGGVLLLEQSHWVRTIRGGHPVVLTVYGRPFPRVLTLGASLVEARVVDLLPALARDFVRAALARALAIALARHLVLACCFRRRHANPPRVISIDRTTGDAHHPSKMTLLSHPSGVTFMWRHATKSPLGLIWDHCSEDIRGKGEPRGGNGTQDNGCR